jgi:hypothetical protein
MRNQPNSQKRLRIVKFQSMSELGYLYSFFKSAFFLGNGMKYTQVRLEGEVILVQIFSPLKVVG